VVGALRFAGCELAIDLDTKRDYVEFKELFKLVGYFAEKGFRNSTFICDAGIDRA
jgi:hypothetical protein